MNETDTRVLVKKCLSPVTNPYYRFIIKDLWPIIKATQPSMIWMFGPPRFSTLAMAMLAKKKIPKVHICAVDYPGEYYSLNKIKKYLKTNSLLFSIIDSVVLYNNDDTQKKLVRAIDNNDSLETPRYHPQLVAWPQFLLRKEETRFILTAAENTSKGESRLLP